MINLFGIKDASTVSSVVACDITGRLNECYWNDEPRTVSEADTDADHETMTTAVQVWRRGLQG